jgi:hypothetical protein
MKYLDLISFRMAIIMSLALGLAPFVPMPHIIEKLAMLAAGDLTQAIDIGDLLFHGVPWVVLVAKIIRLLVRRG